jgi:pseudo-rSAM protein
VLKKISDLKNLNTIKIRNDLLCNNEFVSFAHKCKEYFIGDIICIKKNGKKPLQIPPVLKLQTDLKGYKDTHNIKREAFHSNRLMSNLVEMSIYVCNYTDCFDKVYENAYKQVPYFISGNNSRLEMNLISKLLDDCKFSMLNRINILGGNIFRYQYLNPLIEYLKLFPILKKFFIYHEDLDRKKEFSVFRDRLIEIVIIIDKKCKINKIKDTARILNNLSINYKYCPIVESSDDIKKYYEIDNLKTKIYKKFYPIFTNNNYDFFKNFVFINKQDIFCSYKDLKSILINSKVNRNLFGKISIMSNGNVYSNVNKPSIGNINSQNIKDIIYNEIYKYKYWMEVRKNKKECRSCVFNSLCPPISGYEYVLNQNKICNL